MFVANGSLILVNCTVLDNSASFGTGYSSGKGRGSGIYSYHTSGSGVTMLLNTIVAGNSATTSSPDLLGTNFSSSGFNLIGNNQGATSLSINDYQNEVANLGPLQDNGGPTFTHALLPGSLAIGGGTSTGAPATDQRGVFRPAGLVDIGAFQLVTKITPAITWPTPADITYGTALDAGQLNGSTGVPGSYSYTPPAGTILNAGTSLSLSVLFTPSDIVNYTTSSKTVFINVLKANQGILFGALPGRQIGDAAFTLNAPASSGLPVSFRVVSGPATVIGNAVVLGASEGLVALRASQAGSSNYNPAPDVDQSFILGVPTAPVINQQPASQAVVPGDRVSFTVAASGAPLTFQWFFKGTAIPGEIGPMLTLQRVTSGSAGPYNVVLGNPGGSVASAVAMLSVNVSASAPVISIQPQG